MSASTLIWSVILLFFVALLLREYVSERAFRKRKQQQVVTVERPPDERTLLRPSGPPCGPRSNANSADSRMDTLLC